MLTREQAKQLSQPQFAYLGFGQVVYSKPNNPAGVHVFAANGQKIATIANEAIGQMIQAMNGVEILLLH